VQILSSTNSVQCTSILLCNLHWFYNDAYRTLVAIWRMYASHHILLVCLRVLILLQQRVEITEVGKGGTSFHSQKMLEECRNSIFIVAADILIYILMVFCELQWWSVVLLSFNCLFTIQNFTASKIEFTQTNFLLAKKSQKKGEFRSTMKPNFVSNFAPPIVAEESVVAKRPNFMDFWAVSPDFIVLSRRFELSLVDKFGF
jgi:hypothetical protein